MANTTIKKGNTADTEKFSYKYVSLDQIHEYLEQIGKRYYQYIDRIDGDDYIMTVIINADGTKEEPLRGCRVVNAVLYSIRNPAQEQGSALTYARRYSLLMAFGLATEDDDANSLTRPKTNENPKKETITPAKANGLLVRMENEGISPEKVAELYKVKNVFQLTEEMYSNIEQFWNDVKAQCAR